MKKVIIIIWMFFWIFSSWVFAVSFGWLETGDNFNIDFDSSDTNVSLLNYTTNLCWLGYNWYQLTGKVDTDTVWYIDFSTWTYCAGIYFSWSDMYLWWSWAMTAWDDKNIYFDNVILNWDNTHKVYTFSGVWISNWAWNINLRNNSYISWLNLIDWTKTEIAYDNCKNDSIYANWTACNFVIKFKDTNWNLIKTLTNTKIELNSIPSWLNNKVFMDTDWNTIKTLTVNNGIVTWNLYILKPINWDSIGLKVITDIPDTNWKSNHIINLTWIKIKNPISWLKMLFSSEPVVNKNVDVSFKYLLWNTGFMNEVSNFTTSWNIDVSVITTWFEYSWAKIINWTSFNFKIVSKDNVYYADKVDYNLSTSGTVYYNFGAYFNGAIWEYAYDINDSESIKIYSLLTYIAWLINKSKFLSKNSMNIWWENMRWNIYNKLKKKVYRLILWKEANNSNVITSLDGWISYYKCDNLNQDIKIGSGSTIYYKWKNLLVIENCRIHITENLIANDKDSNLLLFAYRSKYNQKWLDDSGYIDNMDNLYIYPNVSDIQASMITPWSIFTLNWDYNNCKNNLKSCIILSNRVWNINQKQLVILWTVISNNTFLWSLIKKWDNLELPWWKKISYTLPFAWYTNKSDVINYVRSYDFNFLRWYKYKADWSKDTTNWYSEYCKNNVNNKLCKYATIILYDSKIKDSVLFAK